MADWLDAKTRLLVLGLCLVGTVCPGPVAATENVQHEADIEVFTRAAKPGLYVQLRKVLQAENLYGALAGTIMLAVPAQASGTGRPLAQAAQQRGHARPGATPARQTRLAAVAGVTPPRSCPPGS